MKPGLLPYIVAGILVSVPALILENTGNTSRAWAYVGLIVLSLVIFYNREFTLFFNMLGLGIGQAGNRKRG